MKINWYANANGVVGVSWIGPFHFVVNQWHSGDEYRVEVGGNFLASFPPLHDRAAIEQFMIQYTYRKLVGWVKELETVAA